MKSIGSLPRLLNLLLFSVVTMCGISAQELLNGKVLDLQGKPIQAANLILRAQVDKPIISFAISDDQGHFSLKIPSEMDSVLISITHLSYATQTFYVKTDIPELVVELTPQKYELPELVVKNEPFIRKGDTLTFDVSHYREASDENIEQILLRIPGITVEENGRILYDGLDISKFYIEGLDMLEGRYRVVTHNLNIDAIRDIEVIEHHQPIQALDSLVRPENAAINLRLKSNVAITGALGGGTGFSPALYIGRADVFGFAKKQQFNLLMGGNNIGEAQRANFQNLYSSAVELEPEFIFVNQVLPPWQVDKTFYLDNQEQISGFNFLRKLSRNIEFKWQGFANRDRVRNIGERVLKYQEENSEVVFTETLSAIEAPVIIDNRFILEVNEKKVFFRANVQATFNLVSHEADNVVNGVAFPERLEKQVLSTKADLTTILRRGGRAYKVNTDIRYKVTNHDLRLLPVDIFTPQTDATRFQEGHQQARQSKLQTDSYSRLFFQLGRIKGQLKLGARYNHTRLETDLLVSDSTAESNSLGVAFQNDNRVSEWVPYLDQSYKWKKNKTVWQLSLPISLHLFNVRNQLNQQLSTFAPIVFQPRLSYQRVLPNSNTLAATYTIGQAYDEFATLFHEGYVIRSNRTIVNSILDINQYQNQKLYVRLSGKNIAKRSEYALVLDFSETRFDFINENVFTDIGLASELVAARNVLRRVNGHAYWSTQLSSISSFNFRMQYALSSRPSVLNGERLSIQNQFFSLSLSFYLTFEQSVITLSTHFKVFSNNFSTQTNYQFTPTLAYFLQLSSSASISLRYHQYLTSLGEEQIWNEFLHLEYKYQWKKRKLECVLRINNLTDNKDYISFTQNTFSETLSRYRLRPRQLVVSLIKRF